MQLNLFLKRGKQELGKKSWQFFYLATVPFRFRALIDLRIVPLERTIQRKVVGTVRMQFFFFLYVTLVRYSKLLKYAMSKF